MLNKTGPTKTKLTLKQKRFVRSRSRSEQNPIESPRSSHASAILKTFCPKFIPGSQVRESNSKAGRLNQSLRTDCDNNLPMKLKIIQLEEQLDQSQSQKIQLTNQVSKLREEVKLLQDIINNNLEHNKENDSRREVNKTKGNHNLQKLKRQIAQSRLAQPLNELQTLRNEYALLKNDYDRIVWAYSRAEKLLKENHQQDTDKRREGELQNTITQLQKTIKNQEEQNRNLDLRIKVLLAKEAKSAQNSLECSKQAFEELRRRYTKLSKQHRVLKEQMSAQRLKQKGAARPERGNRFVTQPDFRSRSVSLSLSPEDK